jgi:periplasmic copper chaperone A
MNPGFGLKRILVATSFVVVACSPPAASGQTGGSRAEVAAASDMDISISDDWLAATPAGARVAAGYLTIVNAASAPDRLVAASSPRAARVEVHEMVMEDQMMRMRRVTALDVPAGGSVSLKPGGLHLMFMGVERSFREGERVQVTLTFQNAGTVTRSVEVRARNSRRSGAAHGGH